MRRTRRERTILKAGLKTLTESESQRFPKERERLSAPNKQGVYVIYSPADKVLHVGRTTRGRSGLRQRLKNHLHGRSSFVINYFDGKGSTLRKGYKFRFLELKNDRMRALLEAYTTGCLCPDYIGLSLLKDR